MCVKSGSVPIANGYLEGRGGTYGPPYTCQTIENHFDSTNWLEQCHNFDFSIHKSSSA